MAGLTQNCRLSRLVPEESSYILFLEVCFISFLRYQKWNKLVINKCILFKGERASSPKSYQNAPNSSCRVCQIHYSLLISELYSKAE